MFKASCNCGEVQLVADEKPDSMTSCNCSICHRIGALWAYFSADQVIIESHASLIGYQWGEKRITFHSCSRCGSTTHYTMMRKDGSKRTAINSRMVDAKELNNIPVRHFDGAVTWQYM